MNIHEYQAKQLFGSYGIPVATGTAARSRDEVENALKTINTPNVVVKAQIHAGGRGKGTFVDGFQGGVRIASSRTEANDLALKMLGNILVTKQTGPTGRRVQTVYFTEPCDIEKEYYVAILLDRAVSQPVIIASTEGGMDIEQVAAEHPEKIIRVHIDPAIGLQAHQARYLSFKLGFTGEQIKQGVALFNGLWKLFYEKDCSLVEINPLVVTKAGNVLALDAKVTFDDNALFRHKDVQELRDLNEEDPKETEAAAANLNYIALDGNIACLVNGAGLAMATMDIIKYYGGNPANFLDVGGGATAEQVEAAFRIILKDPNVKGILVNIFGGIMKCDIIAQGILAAATKVNIGIPLVVRLEGTNVAEGKRLLAEGKVALTPADSLADAAQKIVRLTE